MLNDPIASPYARGELGPAEMAPEPLGMVRIETHRPANPLDPLFRAAEPGQNLALLDDDEVTVRIEAQRPLLMIGRLVEFVEIEIDRGEDPVNVGVIVVERQRRLQLLHDRPLAFRPVLAPIVHPCLTDDAGLPGVSVSVIGIEVDGAVEILQRLDVAFALRRMMQDLAGEQMFVGRHVAGCSALGPDEPRGLDPAEEGRGDRRCDFILDSENVFDLPVVALGPDVGFGLAVDELDGHSDPVHRLAHAALDNVVDSEFTGDLLRLDRLSLVHEHGVT